MALPDSPEFMLFIPLILSLFTTKLMGMGWVPFLLIGSRICPCISVSSFESCPL